MQRVATTMSPNGHRCEAAAVPHVPSTWSHEEAGHPPRSPQRCSKLGTGEHGQEREDADGENEEEDEADEAAGGGGASGRVAKGNATIVTAYFQVPSKFGSDVYRRWMHNFLAHVNSPMVILIRICLLQVLFAPVGRGLV